ncbi:MAG: hypothetical protein L3J67_12685 [Hyphomicrobiaceae bacterium]|nr:hypothetical protein [Hyphomicrobiaceae bacterium]
MRLFLIAPLFSAILALAGNSFLFSSTAGAASSGLVSLHTLKRVNNRLCMDGHFHYGAGGSPASKAAALANAKRKWADFVILEYGTDWGRFSVATAKGATCTGSRGAYHCSVEASPCKRLRAARTVRKARPYRRYTNKRRYTRSRRSNRRMIARKYQAKRSTRYRAKRRSKAISYRAWSFAGL